MLALLLLLMAVPPQTQAAPGTARHGFPGLAAGMQPKVEIPWNRLYDYEQIHGLMQKLEEAWPGMLRHEVIGHSVESREMRVWVLNDPATGPDTAKPAMWIDGNVHGNEVQGSEAVVYAAWYLLENQGNPRVRALLDHASFYLLPMVNPDGRASWFRDAHTASSSRTGRMPIDDDGDGLFDEDGPDDLDGNGEITGMRKHVPGDGDYRLDPLDPRLLVRVPANERGVRGDWVLLGQEGLDNDGDGRINEDSAGGYDMNRAWPSMWQPEHVQNGAGPYPLYWPEARAIAGFILAHPNIAGVQSYHNAGGMILRGPGAEAFGEYPRGDVQVYDRLGATGESMLPFYRYMIIWKDLYSVFGGFVNWTYEGLGVFSFTNELWNDAQMTKADANGGQEQEHMLNDKLLMGAGFVDWAPFEHPLYGQVEIGGFRKDIGRVPPTFLIEEMLHRNALFALEHADQMPRVEIAELEVSDLGGGLRALDVTFRNARLIPTRSARAAQKQLGQPDVFTLEGAGLQVLAGGFRSDRFRPARIELAEREPARLLSEQGIGSLGEVRVRWLVLGKGQARIRLQGEKFRAVERTLDLP